MPVATFIIPIIQGNFIKRCLETLKKYTSIEHRVIVIDNNNLDEAKKECEGLYHLWISSYRNLGFAKSMNLGATISQTPYIVMCNDDLEFIDKRWWQGVLDTFAMDEKIIAVNPMSPREGAWGYGLRSDNKDTWLPPEGYTKDTETSITPIIDGKPFVYKEEYTEQDYINLLDNHPRWQKGTVCDALAMTCTVWKKEGLKEMGLLDEKFYPAGGEDYDINARAYSCAWPIERDICVEKYHRRMVATTRSWIWHWWGSSKDEISAKDPTNKLFESRPRWNNNDELWPYGFDVWGHGTDADGKRYPYKRIPEVHIEEL